MADEVDCLGVAVRDEAELRLVLVRLAAGLPRERRRLRARWDRTATGGGLLAAGGAPTDVVCGGGGGTKRGERLGASQQAGPACPGLVFVRKKAEGSPRLAHIERS